MKVEILKFIHCQILQYTGGAMKIEQLPLEVLYRIAFELMEDFDIDFKNKNLVAWNKSPILMPGVSLLLTSGYDVFEPAINRIIAEPTLSNPDVYDDIYDDIREIYSKEDFNGKVIVSIFKQPIFEVRGICLHCNDEEIKMLFWSYDDPSDDGEIEIS